MSRSQPTSRGRRTISLRATVLPPIATRRWIRARRNPDRGGDGGQPVLASSLRLRGEEGSAFPRASEEGREWMMQRGSDKHGPLADEQLKDEIEPLERGAPVS